jgi:DNA invertase Pin-like site-specific DNA recombinase
LCFFPWLAGRFNNFELTQNREKTRNGLIKKKKKKESSTENKDLSRGIRAL